MRLLIAIPVHNESKYVDRSSTRSERFHADILVVDDGSTDGRRRFSPPATDIRVIRHAANLGYGQSLIDAFAYADAKAYDWVITMDCDEQHEPEMIPEFIRQIRDRIAGT